MQWGAHAAEPLLTITFVFGLPALLLTMVGSSLLGIALLRRGFRPRASAWLLALTFPLVFVIEQVTSMGSLALPVAFAFGLAGRRLETVRGDRVEDGDRRARGGGADLYP